jgi:alkanesulfonate monooxygenase SsuD/methylene tetrahydromethanopterin reductase-like flavin-dependent oxidoreductase (luciferase family)
VLGLAVGGREDDYAISGADFGSRGRAFDRQLEQLTALWRGERGVGPPPARGERPTVLIGGQAQRTFERVARYADGWTLGGGTPDMFAAGNEKVREAWHAHGREGEPRTMALFYYALGDDAEEAAREDLLDYYAFLGEYAEQIAQSAATDEDTVRQYLSGFEAAGVDEVICFPTSTDPEQVDLLARAVK